MNETKMRSDPFGNCGPGLCDMPLLKQLDLPMWSSQCGVEVHIGDVRPFQEHEQPTAQTVIAVYVQAMPAQAYRFEIVRPAEDGEGLEKLSVRTGTGSLKEFWEMALAIACCMVEVTPAERI